MSNEVKSILEEAEKKAAKNAADHLLKEHPQVGEAVQKILTFIQECQCRSNASYMAEVLKYVCADRIR